MLSAWRGKEIDRVRAKSALEVVREHPVLVLFAASPALALLGVIWWLAGAGWAIFAGVLLCSRPQLSSSSALDPRSAVADVQQLGQAR